MRKTDLLRIYQQNGVVPASVWRYKETLRNLHRQFGTSDYYRNAETWERTQTAERELAAADAAENAPL